MENGLRMRPRRAICHLTLGLVALLILAGVACATRTIAPQPTVPATTAGTSTITSPGTGPSPTASPGPVTADPTPTTAPADVVSVLGPGTADLADTAHGYLMELMNRGPRESASEQERVAAEYLTSELQAMGYSTRIQPFTVERVSAELSGLTIDDPAPAKFPVIPLDGSPALRVSGTLAPIGLALRADIPEQGLDGKIALVRRGLLTFEQKVSRAHDAGAVGVVVYNNEPGNFTGSLLDSGAIPAVGISQEDGERIEEMVASGDVQATIIVATRTDATHNVIAEAPGTGEGVVVLGAHYDTVPGIPGANDNASGTAVLLALAEELSGVSFPFTLRFIAFGSEELGLLGSKFYVDSASEEELRGVVAMLNFDAVGSGGGLRVLGSRDLPKRAVALGAKHGIDVRRSAGLEGGGSDHATFEDAGVPVVMFFSDDFSRIHTPEDTAEFVDPALLGDATRLAIALLQEIASTPEGP